MDGTQKHRQKPSRNSSPRHDNNTSDIAPETPIHYTAQMSPVKTLIIVVLGLLLAQQWRTWHYYLVPPPDYSHGQVVLYATSWCPYCEKTRSLLLQQHVPYKEYDIETSEEGKTQYLRLAGNGVPVLLVAGEVIRGYNEQTILKTLDHWKSVTDKRQGSKANR